MSGLILKHPELGSSSLYVLATSDSSLALAPTRYAKADLLRHPHFKSSGATKISKALGKKVLLWFVSGEFNRGMSSSASLTGKLPMELKSLASIQTVISLLDVGKKSVSFVVHLITKDSKSAEKLNKAIKKGVELMSMLGAMEKKKSKEDKLFMDLVKKIRFKKKGASVQVGLNIPKSLAIEVAKEFAK